MFYGSNCIHLLIWTSAPIVENRFRVRSQNWTQEWITAIWEKRCKWAYCYYWHSLSYTPLLRTYFSYNILPSWTNIIAIPVQILNQFAWRRVHLHYSLQLAALPIRRGSSTNVFVEFRMSFRHLSNQRLTKLLTIEFWSSTRFIR